MPLPPWPDETGFLAGNGFERGLRRGFFLPQTHDTCDDNAETSDNRQNDAADGKMERINAILLCGI